MTHPLRWCLPAALLLAMLVLPMRSGFAGKLSEDGRAGVVLNVQGTALVRPAGHQRWTPLGAKSVLHPGDLVRTQPRGAHALEIALAHGKALLGPGTEVQITAEGAPRLLRGELEAIGTPKQALHVLSAGGFALDTKGSVWLRAEGKRTTQAKKAPRWIESYRASASDEWMGSLLAKVDGRQVPLAVGYHRVDVEVRDQIARTTVEQSFVNSTNARLEGVFYFPLPADASISGFGMWIGGELVEADIVERQRARQIYEDILRRKKDPGLLEWEGGNIFKARVFPIEPHSEKRIRIRYTQVLPLEGDTWHYRYGLRSELLQSRPLRELQIAVRVVSTAAIKAISSPTHEITLHQTGHEATAEFRASEYRPKDDFEVAVTINPGAEITAIPHRRGDDGYFMLLVKPPAEESGAWTRDLAPEGDPLDVILLADTSGSMGTAARANQAAFLESLLSLLGPKDRFRLAAFDVGVQWIVQPATAPSASSIRTALDALAARRSLGWTDLDTGLGAALAKAGAQSLIVYVGDGVSTTGDADPVATADRLRLLGNATKGAAVHAVAASTSYEAGVLTALAETGGGSVRTLGANPTGEAYELLSEVARPSVKNLRVDIQGVRTARVYPRRLPNLPVGAQQVILGRFLPTGEAQEGRVVVTGTLAGKPVRYTAALHLPAGDAGNSFLPRLWGRRHIDALQKDGGGAQTNEEIVAFSERFGIMTPLTSFLVLESDEDRERYGVARRVRMRDGERFFADARDKATLEQKRDLMRAAGRWRAGLRRNALVEIARLGRDLPFYAAPPVADMEAFVDTSLASGFGFTSFGQTVFADAQGDTFFTDSTVSGVDSGLNLDRAKVLEAENGGMRQSLGAAQGRGWGAKAGADGAASAPMGGVPPNHREPSDPTPAAPPPPSGAPVTAPPARKRMAPKPSKRPPMESAADPAASMDLDDALEELSELESSRRSSSLRSRGRRMQRPQAGGGGGAAGYFQPSSRSMDGLAGKGYGYGWGGSYAFTLQTLGFPRVPNAPREDAASEAPPWNPEVLALLRSLPRRDALRGAADGIRVVIRRERLHPTRTTPLGATRVEAWLRSDAWRMLRSSAGFTEAGEAWVHGGQRGGLARARQLARTRDAKPGDANAWWLPLWDLRTRDVIRAWHRQGYTAAIAPVEGSHATIDLTRQHPDERTIRLTIDVDKRVILETRWLDRTGRTIARLTRKDLVEIAGRWWAQTIERYDDEDRLIERRAITLERVEQPAFEKSMTQAALERADALTIHGPLPKRHEAKQAIHERKAVFLDHLILAISLGQQQRAKESLAAWDTAAALAKDKPGRVYIRTVFLSRARQGETFKTWLMGLTPAIEARAGIAGRFLASWLASYSAGVFGPGERGALLERLKKAWLDTGTPLARLRDLTWQRTRIAAYEQQGKTAIATRMRKDLATAWPHHAELQLAFENDLWKVGLYPDALRHLESILSTREPWTANERTQLYTRLTDRLWARRELSRLHKRLGEWLKTKPKGQQAWWRQLSSLFYRGAVEQADADVLEGLAVRLSDADDEWRWGRLHAVVTLALGSGWNFGLQRIEPRFEKPLVDLAGVLFRTDAKHSSPVYRIFQHWRLRQTNEHRALTQALYADLAAADGLASMPLHRLTRYMHWLGWGRGAAPDAIWQTTLDGLRTRWAATKDVRNARVLEAHVLRLLDARGQREAALAFVRTAHERAVGEKTTEQTRLARALFQRLLATPDRNEHQTEARVTECFALLPAMLDPKETEDGRRVQAASDVRRLAARLYQWSYAKGIGSAKERAKLTRAATKALGREARNAARGALAERLHKAEEGSHALHRPWLAIERLGYAVEHGTGLDAIVAEATQILATHAQPIEPGTYEHPLERLMRERAAVILSYAATRKNAGSELVASVLATFAAGDAAFAAAKAKDPEVAELLSWRHQTWRLVVARDDAEQIEADLRRWIVPAAVESRWRVALGYLLAETGRLEGATAQFEAVHGVDELAAADYAALADWYLVLGDDTRRARATTARYAHMNENQLSSLLWQAERRMGRRQNGVPGDFDPAALEVLRALMRKSRYPANYWYRVRNMYRSTKDFRLLESLADGILGHTRESIYAFLGRITSMTSEVHEEATLDEWNRRLTTLAGTAKRPLDRRAMHLAIALVEGRASKVPETDPAHGARGLAALKAAFQEDWQSDERRLMAAFLRGLGRVVDPAVKAEQLRQLELLRTHFDLGTLPRLKIADALAQTLWSYGDQGAAIDLLESELGAVRSAHEGRVPMSEVRIFDRHVHWLSQRGRFAEAERVLLREFEQWDLPMRRTRLRGRLYVLYGETLARSGRVSIGRGEALFRAAKALIEHDMLAAPASAQGLLSTYTTLHRQAQKVQAPGDAGTVLARWARDGFPALLERVPLLSTQYARVVASMIRQLRGARTGLVYLLHRHDTEPRWLNRLGRALWQQDVYHFARWRSEAGALGDLEPRLLTLVTGQLESNLRDGGNHASYFWRGKWAWTAKYGVFADVAGRVAELHPTSRAIVVRCASHLRQIGRRRPATDMLAAAHKRGLLDESSRWTLTRWHREDGSYDKALAVVDGLIKDRANNLHYRIHRVEVLVALKRPADAKSELTTTEAAWIAGKRWSEGVAARLGAVAAKQGFPALAERWMEDAIRRRQDARGNRGGRDSTLSRYYRSLAVARGKLGKTAAAVQAASAAILSANPRSSRQIQESMAALLSALRAAKSLPGHIETHDAEVGTSGLDAPILRKAFAAIFHERKEYGPEITQLLLARELDAGDADVHKRLVAAFDAQGDGAGAVDALFGQIRLAPHTLTAYTDLARRYTAADRPDEAERALTMLVEISPHQAAGHRALATARETQKRLPEAVIQWRQVVRTERLDPTGHLALARALLATEAPAEARTILEHVLATTWERRFADVKAQATRLLSTIKQDRNGSGR